MSTHRVSIDDLPKFRCPRCKVKIDWDPKSLEPFRMVGRCKCPAVYGDDTGYNLWEAEAGGPIYLTSNRADCYGEPYWNDPPWPKGWTGPKRFKN